MKVFFKRFATIVGGLALLLILFHLVENGRGKRAWSQWKQGRIAAGDSFDPAPLAPPEVPDAENFAKAPFFEALVAPTSQGSAPSTPGFPAALAEQGPWGTGEPCRKPISPGSRTNWGSRIARRCWFPGAPNSPP